TLARWRSMGNTGWGQISARRRKDREPVALHIDHDPVACCGLVEGLVQSSDVRAAVVGEFALGIRMPHQRDAARAAPRCSPLQHLLVPVGVAEGEDRTAADEAIDAGGLARAVVDELDPRFFEQRWRAVTAEAVGGRDR